MALQNCMIILSLMVRICFRNRNILQVRKVNFFMKLKDEEILPFKFLKQRVHEKFERKRQIC